MTAPAPYPPVDGTQPCAAEDPELYFLTSSSMDNVFKLPRAVDTCTGCPFRRPCLAYALTHDVHGVWGGTTRAERQRLRQAHGIEAEPVCLPDSAVARIDIDRMDQGGGFLRYRHRPPTRREPANRRTPTGCPTKEPA